MKIKGRSIKQQAAVSRSATFPQGTAKAPCFAPNGANALGRSALIKTTSDCL